MQEREGEAGEVRAAARAADDDVGILARHLHLLERLEADDGLVHQHVAEHRAEAVLLRAAARRRHLDGLGDRDARASRVSRVVSASDRPAELGAVRRAREDLRAEVLHDDAAVGLLVVRDLHHEDLEVEVEEVAGHREGRAPLPGAGLGRQRLRPGFLVVEGLRDGRVRLVRADRADALVLVVDVGRRVERLLEPQRAAHRRRPPEPVDLAHRLGDLDPALGRDLLHRSLIGKSTPRKSGVTGSIVPGMQHRRRRHRHVRVDVVPGLRQPGSRPAGIVRVRSCAPPRRKARR